MKPAFALSFTSESITLQQRAEGGGWQDIGQTLFAVPDPDGALAELRKQALVRGAGDLSCVLILPPELIRHLTVETGTLPRAARLALAEKALDGATPYAVADLAFDISEDGPRTHVAAVAHETLAEAEDFARGHGFVPECFTGPNDGTPFAAPPFFGTCAPAAGANNEPAALPAVPPAPPPTPPQAASEDQPPANLAEAARPRTGENPNAAEQDETAVSPGAAILPPRAGVQPRTAAAVSQAAPPSPARPEKSAAQPSLPSAAAAVSGPTNSSQQESAHPRPAAAKTAPARPALTAGRQAPAADAVNSAKLLQAASARPVTEMPPPQQSAASLSYATRTGGLAWAARFDAMRANPRRLAAASSALLLAAGAVAGLAFLAISGADDGSRRIPAEADAAAGGLVPAPGSGTEEPAIAPQVSVLADQPDPGVRETGLNDTGLNDTGLDGAGLNETAEIAASAGLPRAADATGRTVTPAADTPEQSASLLPPPASSAILEAEPEAPAAPETPEQLALSRAAQYAATGIWQSPPELAAPALPAGPEAGTHGIYVAAIDAGDLSQDAVALPPLDSYGADTPPEPLSSPADPGATFDLDARGLVKATAEGTLNPDGVTIYLGQPAKVPPQPPARPDPAAEAAADAAARDRVLLQKRPRPRPENFAEAAERAQLGGLSRAEMAALRPRPRPASLKPANEAELPATAQAVRSAKMPRPRPANFANLVDRARRNAANTAAAVPAAAVPAAAAAPAPRIPTRASVARSATVDRAINLRKLNLIGVYGSASDRRALIRLPSGRYKKVKVGDRVDGGRVIAIGEGQLQYQKRGKNRTLKMPNG